MKYALLILLLSGSALHTANGYANDYRLISDCITTGDRYIETAKKIESETPRLRGLLVTDTEISAIQAAEEECAKKSADEKAALKKKWQTGVATRYGLEMPPNPPPSSTTGFDHYFAPGGLFNPIHVEIR